MEKLKILISAYGCEPNKGSESGVGWNWVEIMARHYELWVITRKNNRVNIEQFMPKELVNKIHFMYYDLPDSIRRLKRKEKGLYWYYYLWHHGAMKVIQSEMKNTKWDYAMHLSFGSIWLPTYLYKLDIPFIWGPVGGGEAIPDYYLKNWERKSKTIQLIRKKLIKLNKINFPLIRKCKKAELIIARTYDTAAALPNIAKEKTLVMLETAINDETLKKLDNKRVPMQRERVKILYTGRLIPLKAVDMAIEAIALSKYKEKIEFKIVGRGPVKEKLRKLVIERKLDRQVHFLGEVSREEVLDLLKSADMFLFPSLKEGGTWSLMEAMAAGLPSICLKTSGMSIITNDSSAIRITPQDVDATIEEIAKAIDLLISNPIYAANMGKNARKRIEEEFTWKVKEKFIQEAINSLEKLKREMI